MTGIQFSVIICTRNRADMLPECFGALAKLDYPRDRYEVLVVNNASTDATTEVVAAEIEADRFPLRMTNEPEPGLSRARNRGVQEARGEVLVFLDDDGLVCPEWLRGFAEAMADKADLAQGRIVPRFMGGRPGWLTDEWLDRFGGVDQGKERSPLMGHIHGGNCAVRHEVFGQIGLYREALGAGAAGMGEDTEFGLRAAEAGLRILYEPVAHMDHLIAPARSTRRALLKRSYLCGLSQPLFQRFEESKPRALFHFLRRSAGRLLRCLTTLNPAKRMSALCDMCEHWGRVRAILTERTLP